MIKFDKPKELNGEQLRQELKESGVVLPDNVFDFVDDGVGGLLLDISNKDESMANSVIKTHKSKPTPKPTIEQKLASVGLNLDDLRIALGL